MRAVVESLQRLYIAGKITKEQLQVRVDKGTITQAEYDEIIASVA